MGFMKAYFFILLFFWSIYNKKNRGMKTRWPPPLCETFSQNRFFLKDGFPYKFFSFFTVFCAFAGHFFLGNYWKEQSILLYRDYNWKTDVWRVFFWKSFYKLILSQISSFTKILFLGSHLFVWLINSIP